MILTYSTLNTTMDELKELDRTNPYNVVGAFVQIINDFDPNKMDEFYEKLQFLQGDFQPLSEVMKQNVKDRMMQNNKYEYIGSSYFIGASPKNDYVPTEPYQIEITENPYSNVEEGFLKLFVKTGGADTPRGITVRHGKDRNYYIWSDSFMGLLSDIRQKESENPWE